MGGTRSRQTERERLESHEWLTPLRIAFGDEFLSSRDGKSRYLIVNVSQGKTFGALPIEGKGLNELVWMVSGTNDRRDIERIIDHWDFERIKKAVLNGWDHPNKPEGFLKSLEKASKRKPRLLEV